MNGEECGPNPSLLFPTVWPLEYCLSSLSFIFLLPVKWSQRLLTHSKQLPGELSNRIHILSKWRKYQAHLTLQEGRRQRDGEKEPELKCFKYMHAWEQSGMV